MLGQQFYHETMRKVVVAFGTIFNNINIVRKNNSGTVISTGSKYDYANLEMNSKLRCCLSKEILNYRSLNKCH